MSIIKRNKVNIYRLSAIILICVVVLTGYVFASQEAELYNQATAYCLKGQWDKAINSFEELLAGCPSTRFIDAHFWIGYCCQEKGEYKKAISIYRAFSSKYPASSYSSEALYRAGEIYEKYLDDFDSAIALYSELIKKNTRYRPRAEQRISLLTHNSQNGYEPLKSYYQAGKLEASCEYGKAISGYEGLINKYPQSQLVDDAHFRIIKCWEKTGGLYKVKDESKKFIKAFSESEYLPQVKEIIDKYEAK